MSLSSRFSPTNRSREESNNQPHHVMTQPVFLQKIFPFVAFKPSTPLFFKSITSSWSETILHYSGALCCWSCLFKKYSGDDDGEHDDDNGSSVHEDNDDSSGGGDDSSDNHGNTVRDHSAAEIFRLLETCFREIEHPDSLWIVHVIFDLLEYFNVRIREKDIDTTTPHFEVFASLFKSKVFATLEFLLENGNTLIFFNKLLDFFDCSAARVMLPGVLTQLRPYDLPQHMDGIIMRIIDTIEEWDLGYHSEQLVDLAAFLHACFNWFPRNCVVANHLFRRHTPKHQLGDRDRSGKLALVVFDVDNPFDDEDLALVLKRSTPEIVQLVVSFVTSYGLDKVLISDGEEEEDDLRSTILMHITDYPIENLAVAVNEIIDKFGGQFFLELCSSACNVPFFSYAATDRNVEKVTWLIHKIGEIKCYTGIKEFIEGQSNLESTEYDYDDVTEKSSIHFAIQKQQPKMLKYLLDLAEFFGQDYLKHFISLLGRSSEWHQNFNLPPLYFALESNRPTRVTSMIMDKLRSLGDDFLRDQIDTMFDKSDLNEYYYDAEKRAWTKECNKEQHFYTIQFLVDSLLNVVDASEVNLFLKRNLKKYELDDGRNFIRQLKTVDSAEWFVNLIIEVDAADFFCQYMSTICDEEQEEEEDKEYIPSDVLQYLEQALKLMELDQEELDDEMKMK